jgi:hypothetical protein
METLQTHPNGRMIQLIPSRTENSLTFSLNRHQITVFCIFTNLTTFKRITRPTIPTFMHTLTTDIKTPTNETQGVEMGRPNENLTNLINAKTMKNHSPTENTTNQHGTHTLLPQDSFGQIPIRRRNGNNDMLNLTIPTLRSSSQATRNRPSLSRSPPTIKAHRTARLITPQMFMGHNKFIRIVNPLQQNTLMQVSTVTNTKRLPPTAQRRSHLTTPNRHIILMPRIIIRITPISIINQRMIQRQTLKKRTIRSLSRNQDHPTTLQRAYAQKKAQRG